MLIPSYWAEASAQHRERGKQISVRRFGWSNASQEQAQQMAEERAADALQRLRSGEQLLRREPKVPYHGAEGVPIREEVLAQHDDVVITRNSYGARCLNTADVLFADIDFNEAPTPAFFVPVIAASALLGAVIGKLLNGWVLAVVLMFLGLLFGNAIAGLLKRFGQTVAGGPEQQALQRVQAFVSAHPDWLLRLYRTPAGFRLLALHRRFDPQSPDVDAFFRAIHADKQYARMCQLQQCFRARLTAKPWRIGIATPMKPRPGVWPVNPARLPERTRWTETYEKRAADFAACRFQQTLGQGRAQADIEPVRAMHDLFCQAESELPLA